MKLEVGLVNAPTVANSWKNLVNPSLVGMLHPDDGMGWDKGLLLDSTALQP